MPGRQVADVIFCLDASGSMGPCIDGVKRHIGSFVSGLKSDNQQTWDLRLSFLAYCAGENDGGGCTFGFQWMDAKAAGMGLIDALYRPDERQGGSSQFWTSEISEFVAKLDAVRVYGDEAPLVALDTALDFPWRSEKDSHRVVVVLTDESLETGVMVPEQIAVIPKLIQKLHSLRVKLFIVAPSSDAFDSLCAADRCEYETVSDAHTGLMNVDFKKILGAIGKSVSVSVGDLQQITPSKPATRGLFGQAQWVPSNVVITGD